MFRFCYAFLAADQYIKTGMYKNILVIGSEVHSTGLDMTSRGRGVSVIFGDGAGAAVLSREEEDLKEFYLRIYTQKGNMPKN
jgi:3-oxoacyl-[acyl-carrier-protein] synthase-3